MLIKTLITWLCALIPHKVTRERMRKKLIRGSLHGRIDQLEHKLVFLNQELNTLFQYHTGFRMMNDEFQTERQVIFTTEQAPREHIERYVFAAEQLRDTDTVLDCACGVGYGSGILARCALRVLGVDVSEAAVRWADRYFPANNIEFSVGDALTVSLEEPVDVIVSLETIEHLTDDEGLVQNFHRNLKQGGRLICSVPNETVVPHAAGNNPYHMRHYTTAEFVALLEKNGFSQLDIYYQPSSSDPEVRKLDNEQGATIVIVATKAAG